MQKRAGQNKLSISLLDLRIQTQKEIIEKYESLIKGLNGCCDIDERRSDCKFFIHSATVNENRKTIEYAQYLVFVVASCMITVKITEKAGRLVAKETHPDRIVCKDLHQAFNVNILNNPLTTFRCLRRPSGTHLGLVLPVLLGILLSHLDISFDYRS